VTGLLRVALLAALACAALLGADADDESAGFERTPPRLGLVEGEVSFFRPGAADWAPAPVNLALAAGDRLYAGADANFEVQIGPRAFLRAGREAELGVESHEPGFLQLRVASGLASLDLRSVAPGEVFELDTPNAAFTIAESGYYRLGVYDDVTRFTCRGGGRATLVPAQGEPLVVGASEQVVVAGGGAASVESYAAPELDDWDRWSYRRSDGLLDSLSARYVAGEVYGLSDLDQYGVWRTVAPYGAVWTPKELRVGWAPYVHGRWLWDPSFGWTWLDDAPWGWAPFHYGRWISLRGRWAWAPGPQVLRVLYAPALVAFYGSPRTRVAWVPLAWGEPVRPWWGPRRWIGQPHWLGWGGPRRAGDLPENVRQPGGVVAVPGTAFGREPVARVRVEGAQLGDLRLVRGAVPVERAAVSLTGSMQRAGAPPKRVLERSVVSTRARLEGAARLREPLARPPFGSAGAVERAVPMPPPRFGEDIERQLERLRTAKTPRVEVPRAGKDPKAPKPGKGAEKLRADPGADLPGEPANRVYPGRAPGARR
jgi:hypothetical protein